MLSLQLFAGADVMLSLGSFQFGVTTAAYQELSRTSEWRWPTQDRANNTPALQYTGRGADTITLPGVIYPEWRGGWSRIDDLRAMADDAEPQILIDGLGNVLGRWVIERLEEKKSMFAAAGIERKQEFSLSLRKYDDGPAI